jgi:hypothetical protein
LRLFRTKSIASLIQINAVMQECGHKVPGWLAQFDNGNNLRDRQWIK